MLKLKVYKGLKTLENLKRNKQDIQHRIVQIENLLEDCSSLEELYERAEYIDYEISELVKGY